MRPANIFTSVCLFAAASSAWPSLLRRQGTTPPAVAPLAARATSYDLSFSATQGNTATTVTSTKETDSNGSTKKATGTGTSKTGSSTSTTKTFDARLPAGGVSMITPGALDPTTYHKIGTEASRNVMTFAFNYTSLEINPSAVDVLASCSLNTATYTIASNLTFPTDGTIQTVVWDTGAYQASNTLPLLTETYTLIIHDAAKDVSATAAAGYLDTVSSFTFGMYVGQDYTPLSEWTCATCSGALSSMERQTLGFVFGMAAMTVVSFGWFTGAAGLW
ncbi:hypothetical protein LTR08_005512 [Meristemomyces frigidus]|nr:hypothetical protein LTR08_005512 [Meristemomyces frigidus]